MRSAAASILNEPIVVDWPPLRDIGEQVDFALSQFGHEHGGSCETVRVMLERRGLYLDIHGPRQLGGCWRAGWTAEGTTGWNGQPDYYAEGATANEALWRSMWLALVYDPDAAGHRPEASHA